jgi:hypothetical protein
MLQVLEDNFRPSSISNSFTTLLLFLFNDTQGDKESIHEFQFWFEGHLARGFVSVVGGCSTNPPGDALPGGNARPLWRSAHPVCFKAEGSLPCHN